MNVKKLWKKILFPPLPVLALTVLFSTAALVLVFYKGWEQRIISYFIYTLSCYALTILILACYRRLPLYYRKSKEKLYANPYANRYFTDASYKVFINLYRSLAINLLYVAVNAISAYVYQTNWFAIFAIYYAILALMRFLLVRYSKEKQSEEWSGVQSEKQSGERSGVQSEEAPSEEQQSEEQQIAERKRCRLCAYLLMTVNLVLSAVVLMMIFFNRGFEYQGYLIYGMALYTFYMTLTTIISMLKYRKRKSPLLSMSLSIKLAAALFSMLFLETAMFAQFGAHTDLRSKKIMIMATGAAISVIVTSVAINRIVCWTKEIRTLRSDT